MTPTKAILLKAARLKLISFDVDGVLTDGQIIYTDDGHEIKAFNVQDGAAIKMLQQHGIQIAIITGRNSPMVDRRARELGIAHVYQGVADKALTLSKLLERIELPFEAAAHVGDDLPDIELFKLVGLSISVPNGHPCAIEKSDHVTELAGGKGVAREIAEMVLRAQGSWPYS